MSCCIKNHPNHILCPGYSICLHGNDCKCPDNMECLNCIKMCNSEYSPITCTDIILNDPCKLYSCENRGSSLSENMNGISPNKEDNRTGMIVGGVIGGIMGLVLISIIVFLGFYWRKKKKAVNAIYTEAPYMGSGVYDIDSPSTQPNPAPIHSMYPPNHEADSPYDNPVLPIVNDQNAKDNELAKDDENYDNLGNIEEDGEEKEEGKEKKNDPYSRVLPPPRHR